MFQGLTMDLMDCLGVERNQETKKNLKMTSKIGSIKSTVSSISLTLFLPIFAQFLPLHQFPVTLSMMFKTKHKMKKKRLQRPQKISQLLIQSYQDQIKHKQRISSSKTYNIG